MQFIFGRPKAAGLQPPTTGPRATAPPASSLSIAAVRGASFTSAAYHPLLHAALAYRLEPHTLLTQDSSPAIALSPSFSIFFSTEPLFCEGPSRHRPPSKALNQQHLALTPFRE
jgi:hypothetical protein